MEWKQYEERTLEQVSVYATCNVDNHGAGGFGEEARDWPAPIWSPPWWTEALGYLSERTGGINRKGQFRAKVEISSDKVLRHTQELFHPAGAGAKHVS